MGLWVRAHLRRLLFLKGDSMNLEYAVCPHCGCHCEDDEYCAACGKLFHEDTVPIRNDSLLRVLGKGLCSVINKIEPPKIQEDIGEEATLTPLMGSSWSIHHSED